MARRGEREDLDTLLARHRRHIHAYLIAQIGSPDDAEDLCQETLVVLAAKRDDWQPGTSFLAWALAVARYKVLAYRRDRARSQSLVDEAGAVALAAEAVRLAEERD